MKSIALVSKKKMQLWVGFIFSTVAENRITPDPNQEFALYIYLFFCLAPSISDNSILFADNTKHPKLIIAFIAVSDTFTRADLWPQEVIQDTVANSYLEACQMKRDWRRRLGTVSSAVNTELGEDITGKNMQSKHFPCWAVDVKSLAQTRSVISSHDCLVGVD